MNIVYNPGCALQIYKPALAHRILMFLNTEFSGIGLHTVCCRHQPGLMEPTQIINTCAGCDRRFSSLYEGITTISLWEILAASETFQFPNHNGLTLTIHDPCPVRSKSSVHQAVRTVLQKMNITIVEAGRNREHSICCGDDFYPQLPVAKVHERMRARAASMPCEEVCVYCVSCIKSMYIGGKKPRYLVDLLFNEPTDVQIYDTVDWHRQLQEFIDVH